MFFLSNLFKRFNELEYTKYLLDIWETKGLAKAQVSTMYNTAIHFQYYLEQFTCFSIFPTHRLQVLTNAETMYSPPSKKTNS